MSSRRSSDSHHRRPGAGKTTLINLLRDHGFAIMPEAGRAIIQDQAAIGGRALPWADTALFAELMLSWDIRSCRQAARQPGLVFFDHAVPCVAAYLRLLGQPVPAHVDAAVAAFRYRQQVFIAPPWPEIYHTDTERQQNLDKARRTYHAMAETYTHYGYELFELPRTDPIERLRFVLHPVTQPAPAAGNGWPGPTRPRICADLGSAVTFIARPALPGPRSGRGLAWFKASAWGAEDPRFESGRPDCFALGAAPECKGSGCAPLYQDAQAGPAKTHRAITA